MSKKVNDHYLMKAWAKFAKENGGCIQCQYPWYDGLCECDFWHENSEMCHQIENLAEKLVKQGWSYN